MSSIQRRNLVEIDVQSKNLHPRFRELQRKRKPDVTQTNDRNFHIRTVFRPTLDSRGRENPRAPATLDQRGWCSPLITAASGRIQRPAGAEREGRPNWAFLWVNCRGFASAMAVALREGAPLETTIWRLESRQNPNAGKRALRSAAFPGCGLAELSSSATGARLRRTLVVLPRSSPGSGLNVGPSFS